MFTGHRNCTANKTELQDIVTKYKQYTWIHGGASGFDAQIEMIAKENGIKTQIYRPDYKKYPNKTAPIMRNIEMLNICDVVIACYDGRKHGGTYQVITSANRLKKALVVLPAIAL
jgi:molybdopterin/thiamine biosynthesis adenylyltransferase